MSAARPSTWMLWFGVLGGAVAWLIQFPANLYLTFAQCNNLAGRWNLPIHELEIGLSALAFAIGGIATAVSARIFRATYGAADDIDGQERRGDGSPPPVGRIHFLSIVALTVNVLALTIVVLTGVGAPLLRVCQQS